MLRKLMMKSEEDWLEIVLSLLAVLAFVTLILYLVVVLVALTRPC